MGWLITAVVIVLLAVLPVGVSAVYNTHGPVVRITVGPFRFVVFPQKKKAEKKKKPTKTKIKTEKKGNAVKKQEKVKDKTGGSITDFLPLVQTALDFLGAFRRKLRLNRLEMKLIMAADDPCDLAVNYGKAWAAVGNLLPQLERFFVIRKRNVEVACDFTSEKTLIFARLDLTITVGRVLSLATVYGIRIVRQFLSIMKTRKGGAVQ